ncbi:MAG: hypothetical protein ACI4MA_10055 [Treponema sp.]
MSISKCVIYSKSKYVFGLDKAKLKSVYNHISVFLAKEKHRI